MKSADRNRVTVQRLAGHTVSPALGGRGWAVVRTPLLSPSEGCAAAAIVKLQQHGCKTTADRPDPFIVEDEVSNQLVLLQCKTFYPYYNISPLYIFIVGLDCHMTVLAIKL